MSKSIFGKTIDGENELYLNINEIKLNDGTAAEPSLTFINDTNTGIFRLNENTLAIATDGISRVAIDTNKISIEPEIDALDNINLIKGSNGNLSIRFRDEVTTGMYMDNDDFIRIVSGSISGVILSRFGVKFTYDSNEDWLDRYNRGFWLPTIGDFVNLTGTPSINSNFYQRIGDIINCNCKISGLTITSANIHTALTFTLPPSHLTLTNATPIYGTIQMINTGIINNCSAGICTDHSSVSNDKGYSCIRPHFNGDVIIQLSISYECL